MKMHTDADGRDFIEKQTRLEEEKKELHAQKEAPRYLVDNTTSQALADLMSHNKGAMMSRASDARGIIGVLQGRHEKGSGTDEEFYLKAYTVSEGYRCDRLSRQSVLIPTPCLQILWLIQRDMYESLWKRDSLVQGGLLPRFLTCRAFLRPKFISSDIGEFSPRVEAAYGSRVMELLETYRMHSGQPYLVPRSRHARDVLFDYTNRIIERCNEGEFTQEVEYFARRWAENAWKIALVFHAAKHGKAAHLVELDETTARSAVSVVSWFSIEQLKVLEERANQGNGDKAEQILTLIRRTGQVTISRIKKAKICSTTQEAEEILGELIEAGTIQAKDFRGHGRPTTNYSLRTK